MLTTAHRFLLVLLAVLVLAPPAGAAEVARSGSDSLDVRDDRGSGTCLRLMQGSSGGGTCERAPVRERRSSMQTFSGSAGLVIGGAVPASVARAQAELSDGRRPAVDTVAGERNRGRYAGRLRYFLISTRPADRDDLSGGGLVVVRFLGGDGTLQGPPGSATARARS